MGLPRALEWTLNDRQAPFWPKGKRKGGSHAKGGWERPSPLPGHASGPTHTSILLGQSGVGSEQSGLQARRTIHLLLGRSLGPPHPHCHLGMSPTGQS